MKLTGSQLVAEILLEHGVDTVFGYPGGTALNLYDTLYIPEQRGKPASSLLPAAPEQQTL